MSSKKNQPGGSVVPDHPLSPGGCTFALLDANVLLPPRLSDVLFDFHGEGLFFPRWTGKIEEEFLDHWADVVKKTAKNERAAGKKKDDTSIIADKAKAINRLRCFRAAVGMEYEVVGYGDDEILTRVPDNVDEGDIHLVAAALVLLDSCSENGSNDRIIVVSRNIRHLAVNNVGSIGIDVMAPGCFIDSLLSAAKERVGKSLEKTVSDLTNPPYTKKELLMALSLHEATKTAQRFSKEWGVCLDAER